MSVGPTRGPIQRPSDDRDFTEIFQRLTDLERVAPSGAGSDVLVGQVYNDAEIIAGTGFTAEWADEDGSSPGANYITVRFDTPFADPPTVLLTGNNNNPADVLGEYGVSVKSVAVDYFVAVGIEFDGTESIGGFNFAAFATDPYVPPP